MLILSSLRRYMRYLGYPYSCDRLPPIHILSTNRNCEASDRLSIPFYTGSRPAASTQRGRGKMEQGWVSWVKSVPPSWSPASRKICTRGGVAARVSKRSLSAPRASGATSRGRGNWHFRARFSIEPIFTRGLNVSPGRCQDQHSDRFGCKAAPRPIGLAAGHA